MNGNATSLNPTPAMADIIDDANSWAKENIGIDPGSILKAGGDINNAIKENTGIDLVEEGRRQVFPNAPSGGASTSGGSATAQPNAKASGVPTWAYYVGGGALVIGGIFWYAFKK